MKKLLKDRQTDIQHRTSYVIKQLLVLLQVDPEGKGHGHLKADDYILAVNGMAPESLSEGEQLIKDAFRTLTLTVWR